MSSIDTKATGIPTRASSMEDRQAYLRSLQQVGNDERIMKCAEYIMGILGHKMPTRPTEFKYGRWENNGNIVPIRQNVPYVPPGVPSTYSSRVLTTTVSDQQMRHMENTSNYIAGEYTLTVDGIDLSFARGEYKQERDPETKRMVINVVPVHQNFPSKFKVVDPQASPVEWMWLYMHPANTECPGRIPLKEQRAAGITVRMIDKYYLAYNLPNIKMDVELSAKAKEVHAGSEAVELSAKIMELDAVRLKEVARATGCVPSEMDMSMPLVDVYRAHLHKVLNDNSGLQGAEARKATLRVMLKGAKDFYAGGVERAVRAGVLFEEDGEWFLRDADGGHSQPHTLERYLIPQGCEVAAEWLAAEMDRNRDDQLLAIIEEATRVSGKVPGKREATDDAIAAIDRAIATGTIERVPLGQNRWEWRNRNGDSLGLANGTTKEQHRKHLVLYAASVSLPTLLMALGLAGDAG